MDATINVISYINGKRIEEEDWKNIVVDCDEVLKVIKAANDRLNDEFRQETLIEESS